MCTLPSCPLLCSAGKFSEISIKRGDAFTIRLRIASSRAIYDVRQGTRRDAVLFSVGANASHGLRRTNEDKRRAVMVLLTDEEWQKWSDNEVAKKCAVSQPFVSSTRKSLATVASEPIGERAYYNKIDSDRDIKERLYTTRHGTVATMAVANIGSRPIEVRASSEPSHAPTAATIRSGLC